MPDAAAYTQCLLGGGNPLSRWSHRNRYDRTIASAGREVLGANLEIKDTAHSPLPALRAMGNATVLWRCRAR